MKKIFKYIIPVEDIVTELEIPLGGEILSCLTQDDEVCIWVKVDPNARLVTRSFKTVGTGHQFRDEHTHYIGTVLIFNGTLVFHLFELK